MLNEPPHQNDISLSSWKVNIVTKQKNKLTFVFEQVHHRGYVLAHFYKLLYPILVYLTMPLHIYTFANTIHVTSF